METAEYEFLALIVNYPDLLEKNILKEEYFEEKEKIMFHILTNEYQRTKTFVVENLAKYKNFDIKYFVELLDNNMYNSSREIKFEELQKTIINKYKNKKYKEIINSYNGDFEDNLKQLNELNELTYQEVSYIYSKDMLDSLLSVRKKVYLGYSSLDYILNLSQNDLLIVAGSTGGGKSTFALNLLYNLSKEYQCIYFNMEMSKSILYKRLIACSTELTMQELNDAKSLDIEKKNLIISKTQEIESRKIIMINGSLRIDELKKNIIGIKTDKPIIVFLDHIGLIKSSGSSLYEKMTNTAKALRTLCLDCNCTIIGLSQLSRGSQMNNDIPKLQDLRDSGEIEQSARKVIFIHDKDKGKQDRQHNVSIIVAKNDDGASNVSKDFVFDRHIQKFKEKYN